MLRSGIRAYLRLRPRRTLDVAAQVDEEIALHIELRTRQLLAQGFDPEAARAEAEHRFGGLDRTRPGLHELARERERAMNVREWLAGWRQDLAYSARALLREPLLALVVVLTLALGIGANATIFGIVDQLLVRGPAHVASPEQLRRVYVTQRTWQGEQTSATTGYVTGMLLRELPAVFAGVSVYRYARVRLGRGEQAAEEWVGSSTADLFELLGVEPLLGRFFTEAEDRPHEAEPVAVLDHAYWRTMFGGARDVLGRTITIDGAEHVVIGVAPPGFTGPELRPATVWVPFSTGVKPHPEWVTTWHARWAQVLVRLRPEMSVERANAAATTVFRAAAAEAGQDEAAEARIELLPPGYTVAGLEPREVRISRWLAGVSVIVLLAACANVMNLLLARGMRRRRELAVRLALGVSRARLARLLLSETLLLAIAAGVLAIGFVYWGGPVLRATLLPEVPWDAPLNARVLLFSGAVVVLTGLVVGLAKALQAARQDLTGMLKTSTAQGGLSRSALRGALTAMQTAFALILLVGAGLFVRSLWNVSSLPLGIEADRVLAVWTTFRGLGDLTPEQQETERARRAVFHEDAVQRLHALPDIDAAAVAIGTPLQGTFGVPLRVPGWDSIPPMPGGGPYISAVGPGYFETVGTRILRGRGIEPGEGSGSEPIVVVNESMARTLWPTENAIGQCLFIGPGEAPCARVVGIAEDAQRRTLTDEPAFQYYIPFGQERGIGGTQILVRPRGKAAAFEPQLRSMLHALEPGADYFRISTLQSALDPQIRPWRLGATMFVLFGGLVLIIATIGLYSVMAYNVAQRRIELGVRLALGARAATIVALVLRQGLALVLLGIAAGVPLALLGGRFLESLLFDTSPNDVTIVGAVLLLLLIVAMLASIIPAARAAHTDPVDALRSE